LHPDTFSAEWKQLHQDVRRLPEALREYADAYRTKGNTFEPQAETLDRARGLVENVGADFNVDG
jgi:uncharacterized protein YukE